MTAIYVAAFVMLVGAILVLLRALRGPTVFDRILAVNMLGTKAVIVLALLGSLHGRGGYLDIALLYALLNYVGTVAVLKFVGYRRLG
ncbi:MAG: monovalent cation/H+ antiporter complex subunit F [Planctomycetota bacterium]